MRFAARRLGATVAIAVSFCIIGSTAFSRDSASGSTAVDADRLIHDDKRLLTIFEGRVTLRRGPLTLRGDRLELRQMPDGSNRGVLTGQPARLQQIRSGYPGERMSGEAQQIDYDSSTDVVVLAGGALMRRLSGDRELERISGRQLVYQLAAETYQVDTNPSEGRSRMTVTPDAEQSN